MTQNVSLTKIVKAFKKATNVQRKLGWWINRPLQNISSESVWNDCFCAHALLGIVCALQWQPEIKDTWMDHMWLWYISRLFACAGFERVIHVTHFYKETIPMSDHLLFEYKDYVRTTRYKKIKCVND